MHGIQIQKQLVGARFDIALLSISGYVDTTTCHELSKTLSDLISEKHYEVITDLSRVTYISSAGWGVFMGEIRHVREKGGDIKIVQMTPEVNEVFEMLEFNRILNSYDSVEEAMNEFDLIRGYDITKSDQRHHQGADQAENDNLQQPVIPAMEAPMQRPESLTVRDFPLVEKIKMVILNDPNCSTGDIKKMLQDEKYGYVKIGHFRLRSILRKLSLDSKEKRNRYFRSR